MLNLGQRFEVKIPIDGVKLPGILFIPYLPKGLVIFSHGSGSSHKSSRNQFVSDGLNGAGFATLLFDLMTPEEEKKRENVFNIAFLSGRLLKATEWAREESSLKELNIGYFGASTGAAAALVAASLDPGIFTVVSRGGRPDLAMAQLRKIECSVLLIVGKRDSVVLELNKKAQDQLSHCELKTISGATHLFEEPGTLEEVLYLAEKWFSKEVSTTKIKNRHDPDKQIYESLKEKVNPFTFGEDLRPLLERISSSRIVMLGEATHGTTEFYSLRKVITQKLIEDYGFNTIAVEGDWSECQALDKYINNKSNGDLVQEVLSRFKRWPTWLWANREIANLSHWLRGRNVGFFGLDIYSLFDSVDAIKALCPKLSADLSGRLLRNYSCFDQFKRDEIKYTRSLMTDSNGCESPVTESLKEIMALNRDDTSLSEREFFNLKQYAKLIKNSEKYYREMIYGGRASWNVRDNHMLEMLQDVTDFQGCKSKVIVWAHNTHVGDYRATDMFREGYVNLGGLARAIYGKDNVSLIGFGTNSGEVLAGKSWGADPEVMTIPPAPKRTYEGIMHELSQKLKVPQFFMSLKIGEPVTFKRGHRAIGVVYQPSHYIKNTNFVPTELANRYDEFIYIDKTTALVPLEELSLNKEPGLFPTAWPVGT